MGITSLMARVMLVLSALIVGCSDDASPPAPAPAPTSSDGAAGLQALLDAEVAKPEVYSAIARVEVGASLVFAGASGTLSGSDSRPVQAETPFRSASVGKLFTAVAVLQLAEQGKLSLEEPLSAVLPPSAFEKLHVLGGVNRGGDLTIRQLLGHTTGLPDVDSDPAFFAAVSSEPARVWKPEELLGFAIAIGPKFAPGSGQLYSSANYWVLGMVIEATAKKPFHSVIRQQILDPLGLPDTFEETHEGSGSRPLAHSYIGETAVNLASPSFEFADGGFVSTTADLARFGRALARGELFERPETLAEMLTPQGSEQIGLGPFLGEAGLASGPAPFLFHPGYWGVGLLVFPEQDAAIAYTINQANADASALLTGLVGAVR